MFKNKKLSLLLVAIMVFSMMLTGCQGGDEAESGEVEAPAVEEQEANEESPEVEEVEEVQLSDWDGTWNNMGAYLDDEELEEALTHFHLRYGEDLDEILADEEWYPVLVKPNSTYDQLYEEVTE